MISFVNEEVNKKQMYALTNQSKQINKEMKKHS